MENKEPNFNQWVEERLAALQTDGSWNPDTAKARRRLQQRARVWQWRRWRAGAATAAAVLMLAVVLGAPRACANPRGCSAGLWQKVFSAQVAADQAARGP